MKTYRATFQGRTLGAIGRMQRFALQVEAEDRTAAELKLYDTHEHIMFLQLEEVTNDDGERKGTDDER